MQNLNRALPPTGAGVGCSSWKCWPARPLLVSTRGQGAAVRTGWSADPHDFLSTSTSVSNRSSGPGHLCPVPMLEMKVSTSNLHVTSILTPTGAG